MTTPPDTTIEASIVAALGEMQNPRKAGAADLGQFSYRFATLADVLELARPILARHNLALITELRSTTSTVVVSARWLHTSGATLPAGELELPRGGSAQSLGSAATYSRRYLLTAALGIAGTDDDDDGAAAAPLDQHRHDPELEEARTLYERAAALRSQPAAVELIKQAASEAGRRLTVDELRGYPAWRAEVAALLEAVEQQATTEPAADTPSSSTGETPEPAEDATTEAPTERAVVGSRARRNAPQTDTETV